MNQLSKQYIDLMKEAMKYREQAYVPYSNFKVGAAILTEEGKIYGGCNIENASYGATNCAERTAIFKAVSEGVKKISAIAIIGDVNAITYPCGICRQVMLEFGDENVEVIVFTNLENYEIIKLKNIMPYAFTKLDLTK